MNKEASLPLKAQVAIRDRWEKPNAPARQAVDALRDALGLDIVCELQWPLLVAELDAAYEDKGHLVAAVMACLQAWFVALADLLDDEKWTETMLGKLKEASSRLVIFIEVSTVERPSTSWSSAQGGFIVAMPKTAFHQGIDYDHVFKMQLLNTFPSHKPSGSPGEDWADVGMDLPARASPAHHRLPDINTLLNPETLTCQPPYHLIIHATGRSRIDIQCSHSPTLETLVAYLRRWCRVNSNQSDRPPAVDIQLHQSSFGLGQAYDALSLSAEGRYAGVFAVSPVLVLALVEGVLGYKRVSGDASSWHYRRDTPLKTS